MSGTNPPSRFSPEGAASNQPANPTSPPSLSSSAYPAAPSPDRTVPPAPGAPNPGDQRPTKMPTAAWVAIAVLAALAALAGTLYVTKDSSTAADPTAPPATQPNVPQTQSPVAPVTQAPAPETAPPASETAAPIDTAPPVDTAAPADTATADPQSPTPATPNPGATPTPITATGEGWIPSGTYKFPEEIGPGRYRVARSYSVMDTEGNETFIQYNTNEGMVVLILPEGTPPRTIDIVGGAWPLDTVGPVDPTQYHDGVYLVGYDIQPGTYRVTPLPNSGGGNAYLARLDENLEIIENSLVEYTQDDNPVVTLVIEPSDYAIEFTGALEKVD